MALAIPAARLVRLCTTDVEAVVAVAVAAPDVLGLSVLREGAVELRIRPEALASLLPLLRLLGTIV